ncbi:MAG: proton-conducting transporter membrane subunit, partial [Thermodesulfovibrionales bacterium]
MNADGYLYIGVLCYLLGAVSFLLPFRNIRSYLYIFSTAGALAFAVFGLFTSWGLPVQIPSFPISSLFAFVFRGDALSGFFMIIISVLAFAVSIFSVGYARELRNNGLLGFLFNLFILTMYAVVLSGNIITFLISWEAMSVVSYFLVSFDRDEESAKAGLLYAVMTHIGTAFIIALFLILYSCTGQMDFWGIKSASAQIPDSAKAIVFVFSTIGFGMKAGIVPLHTWLPRAHPAAPSNISALMSGVMIKTGIYGFIRICMDLMGPV